MTQLPSLLESLAVGGVRFIVIGGIAATAHGSARVTLDVDCVYARDPENIVRLVAAIRPLNPSLRGAPPGLPFRFDEPTVRAGLNFTLETDAGPIDLFGEVAGGGTFDQLLPRTAELRIFGHSCRVVTLEALIALKRAAGRPKDLEAIAELQAIARLRREA